MIADSCTTAAFSILFQRTRCMRLKYETGGSGLIKPDLCAAVNLILKTPSADVSWGASSNVDMVLTQNAQAKTRLFKSGSIYLIFNVDLVSGTGFEPVTFRL